MTESNPIIRWTTDQLRYIFVIESTTGADVLDVEYDPKKNVLNVIVREGHGRLVIGKGGQRVKTLENMLKKKIRVVELPNDPVKFAITAFKPARITAAFISETSDGQKILNIVTPDKGVVRRKMKSVLQKLNRYFGISQIKLVS